MLLCGSAFPASIPIESLTGAACKERYADKCPLPDLPLRITNTGNVTFNYVALVFISTADAGPTLHLIKQLTTYRRLRDIAGGATAEGALRWTVANLARHDAKGNIVLYPRTYSLAINTLALATVTLTLTGKEVVLDSWPAA